MVQQYVRQQMGMVIRLIFTIVIYKQLLIDLTRDSVVSANGISIRLTGEAESYAYYAVLSYLNFKIEFLIYPDFSWGLGRTLLASSESEFAYFTAWDLWVKFVGFRGGR